MWTENRIVYLLVAHVFVPFSLCTMFSGTYFFQTRASSPTVSLFKANCPPTKPSPNHRNSKKIYISNILLRRKVQHVRLITAAKIQK